MWKFAFMFFFSISLLLGGTVEVEAEIGCSESSAIDGVLRQGDADVDRCNQAIREENWSNYITYMRSAKGYLQDAVNYNRANNLCGDQIRQLQDRIKYTGWKAAIAKTKNINKKYELPPGAPKVNIPRN